MSKKKQKETAAPGVKQSTLVIAVIIALAVGFYLGAMFTTVYKANTGGGTETARMPGGAAAGLPGSEVSGGDQFAREIAELKNHLEHEPNDADAWTKLGHFYFDSDRYAPAIDAYEHSLALKPGDPNVLTDLGVMYRRNGNPQKAVESFDLAIAADPTHEVSRFNKGTVLMHDLKDSRGALVAWEGLLEINPDAKSPGGQPITELVDGLKKSMDSMPQ